MIILITIVGLILFFGTAKLADIIDNWLFKETSYLMGVFLILYTLEIAVILEIFI